MPYKHFIQRFAKQGLVLIIVTGIVVITPSSLSAMPLQAMIKNNTLVTNDSAFSAVLINNKIHLSWGDAGEKNISHYIIEKCADKTYCTDVALFFTSDLPDQPLLVTASASSLQVTPNTSLKIYRYKDAATYAKNKVLYYRLKAISKNGDIAYSAWQTINLNKK